MFYFILTHNLFASLCIDTAKMLVLDLKGYTKIIKPNHKKNVVHILPQFCPSENCEGVTQKEREDLLQN